MEKGSNVDSKMVPMEKTKRFRMNREGIGFFKAILESYEDVGIFSVLDGGKGLVEVIYPSCFEKDILAIIDDMGRYALIFEEADGV